MLSAIWMLIMLVIGQLELKPGQEFHSSDGTANVRSFENYPIMIDYNIMLIKCVFHISQCL